MKKKKWFFEVGYQYSLRTVRVTASTAGNALHKARKMVNFPALQNCPEEWPYRGSVGAGEWKDYSVSCVGVA